MKVNTNPIRGTYDYAPRQAELREDVKQIILKWYRNNGFSLINTPILENLELLNSSDGGDNLRLMFKTIKRGDKLDLSKPNLVESDIAEEGLRYDLTVPLARFFANNRDKLPNPFKAIQIDYSFRAERPQRGRDRQFIQCDIDEFGDAGIEAEIDVLSTGVIAYQKLGFDNLTVKINSRQILNSIVLNAGFETDDISTICVSLDKIDKIGIGGVEAELLEKFNDTNNGKKNVDTLISCVNDVVTNGLNNLIKYGVKIEDIQRVDNIIKSINNICAINQVNYKCKFDISIVRGQGYYTGVIYEVYTEGFKGAIGGGGRYDKMINKLIGIDIPAVGFSIGFAPVCMLLEERGVKFTNRKKIALIYNELDYQNVILDKQKFIDKYDISLYKRPKNLKNLLDKLVFANFDGFAMYQPEIKQLEIKSI